MADAFKTAQSYPNARTLTTLYTVPGATSTVCSTLFVCNQGTSQASVRISVAIAGAADARAQYLYYDVALLPNETRQLNAGISLATTDVVRCYSSTGTVSFNLSMVEVT